MATPALKLPVTNKRLFKYLVLDNGLKVLLVSDKDTDKAGAAVDVNIGSFSDPELLPGLAHFLEHMLFMGSKKYPEENAYEKYLSEHGGSSNAWTASESTNYYFDITKDYLKEALDMFAQFFIDPLMAESATARELKAVNNEDKKNFQVDSWRNSQILKAHANPGHPFHKFSTGNIESLQTEPAKHNINVRQALIDFHNKYYSANIMSLCVIGAEPLEVLEKWIRDSFSPVPNKNIMRPTWTDHRPFLPTQLTQLVTIVPVKQTRAIKLNWPIPPQWERYGEKASQYCSHLLGHEGQGSLFALLRNKGWATALVAGAGNSSSDFEIFKISIELTEEGFAKKEDVVVLTFEYLHLLKKTGPVERIWRESKQIHEIDFKFLSKQKPMSLVGTLSNNMQWYKPEDTLAGPYLYEDFNPQSIEAVINSLTVENLLLCYVAKEFEGKTTAVEKWYKTPYSAEPIPDALRARIQAITSSNSELHMPGPNEFIPTELHLKSDAPGDPSAASLASPATTLPPLVVTKIPNLIHDKGVSKVWHLFDTSFAQPKVNIHLQIFSPETYASAENAVKTEMLVKLVQDALNEYSYDATLAGLEYKLVWNTEGIELTVSGFDQKLPVLLKKVIRQLVAIQIDPIRFAVCKEKLALEYENHRKEPVHSHARYFTFLAILTPRWTFDDKLPLLAELDLADVQHFVPTFRSSIHLEWLICGNYTAAEVKPLVEEVEAQFEIKVPGPFPQAAQRQVKLHKGITYLVQQPELNLDEVNSAVFNTYQIGALDDFKLAAQCSLLEEILSEPAYDQLRTKEQLGYIVWSGIRTYNGAQTWRIVVQSSDYDAVHLDKRVEAFLVDAKTLLKEMDDSAFKAYVEAVIALKFEKPHSLGSLSTRLWEEVSERRYFFARPELEVEELKKITLEDMQAFFNRVIGDDKTRRKLSVLVHSQAHPLPEPQPSATRVVITNFNKFKESMPLYPIN